MEFSKAQYEAVLTEINTGLDTFSHQLNGLVPAATAAVNRWFIPPDIQQAVIALAEECVDVGRALLQVFVDLLKGAVAPIFMFHDAWQWKDIRGEATGISSSLSEHNLVVDNSEWSGKARDAYVSAASAQAQAAERIGTIADSTANHLLACAAAGAAFYVTLAIVLAKLITAAITAIAALGSVVFSWAGLLIILEEAGVNTTIIGTAVATLTTFLTAQAVAMVQLHGEAVDGSKFPGGKWPSPNSSTYNDATVTDGDADWSLAG